MLKLDEMLEPSEVARMLGVTERTLLDWRRAGLHLPYYRASGKKVVYSRQEVEEYINSRRQAPKPVAVVA